MILFLILFFIFGCAKKKPHQKESFSFSPSVSPGGEVAALFPHPEGWSGAGSHGVRVNQRGTADCLPCHRLDPDTISPAPACHSCHPLYPHQENWVAKENHGGLVLLRGKESCGTLCHGTDFQGGLSQTSCNQCHAVFPHASNWPEGSQHGASAKGEGKKLCQACHGEDLRGGKSEVSCYRCHEIYPHEPEWALPTKHGGFVSSGGRAVCATTCHGSDLEGGGSQVSCNQCHQLYPHSDDWAERHRQVARDVGLESCARCHGGDFRKEIGGKNCYSCHADYPHPPRERWVPFQGGHGAKIKNEYDGKFDSCQRCHGEDLSRRINDENCSSCHSSYPIAHRQENWNRYEGHGADVLSNGLADPAGNPRCLQCHDRERGGPYGARSCQNAGCHSVYPHEMMGNWDENHGQEAVDREVRILRCAGCHGSDFRRVLGGVNCYSCHTNFPHLQDLPGGGCPLDNEGNPRCWTTTWFTDEEACEDEGGEGDVVCRTIQTEHVSPHAEQYLEQQESDFAPPDPTRPELFNQCRRCHGEDYRGGVSEIACFSCHPGYPHRAGSNWRTATGGDHTGSYLEGVRGTDSPCALCHRNLRGGIEGQATSCAGAACHADYPHTATDWTSPGRASEHANRIISTRNASPCRACHGDDFSRVVGESEGHEGTSCQDCHPQGPATHENRQGRSWDAASGHGNFFSGRYQAVSIDSDCRNCHGSAVTFLASDTRASLGDRSRLGCENCSNSCYTCHWAYPHVSVTSGANEYPWEPVNTANCGARSVNNATGHALFLLDSPLLTNTSGQRPVLGTTPAGSPLWRQAIQNTCGGGTAGSCHFKGNRSYRTGQTEPLCGQYCHGPDRPLPPPLPPCPPPPAPICEGGTCCYGEGCLEHCTPDSCWEE
ncbi:MAG: hypothetical protein HYY44_02820 [Deltaproteobacteria bacterium]|nr:hypothetical protein [Deltaproteobacteria bacterium]